jgi:hypothetical protein
VVARLAQHFDSEYPLVDKSISEIEFDEAVEKFKTEILASLNT